MIWPIAVGIASLITGIILGARFTRASIRMDADLAADNRRIAISDEADMATDGAS